VNPNLIEAELFGYIEGAFTGAHGEHPGVFERAHGGTLFLDEIGELPLELQPKLLRILEEKELRRLGDTQVTRVDVRIVTATHRDLSSMIDSKKFRGDLFHRLNVLPLEIPPLRKRREDIRLIATAMLGEGTELDDSAISMLESYSWPGNVRELKNTLLRARATSEGGRIGGAQLALRAPVGVSSEMPPVATTQTYHAAKELCLDAFERSYVTALLSAHGGNVTHAAAAAEIPPQTLRRLIAKHAISRKR
jgi:two-component system response regulator AtoC